MVTTPSVSPNARICADAVTRFLFKYVSRDTVELLGSGKAGVTEARAVLAQYEEKSPLYGLIMFRRRKVLLKYIPDGTSRLLQGRSHLPRAPAQECV